MRSGFPSAVDGRAERPPIVAHSRGGPARGVGPLAADARDSLARAAGPRSLYRSPMPEPSHRRRLLVLAICCLSLLIVSLDNTVLNVALPSMQKDLDTSVSGM